MERARSLSKRAGSVSTGLVRATLGFSAARYGLDAKAIQARHGLDGALLDDTDARVESTVYEAVVEDCAAMCGDALFGLRLGEAFTLSSIGALGFALLNSASLESALRRYESFQRALGEGIRIRLGVAGDEAKVSLSVASGSGALRHRVESFVASTVAACRELAPGFAPKAVTFRHEVLESLGEYRRVLGVAPMQGAVDAIVFDRVWLARPVRGADVAVARLLDGEMRRREREAASQEWKERTANALVAEDGSWPSAAEVASKLGVSQRTLQVRLAEEGTTFRAVYDETLRRLAERFLDNGDSLAEIAFALGYSEPAAFSKAFVRWTGLPPGAYRRRRKTR